MQNSSSAKIITVFIIALLMTSILLTAMSAQGQVAPLPGVTNWRDGSSMLLPTGVTPDQSFETVAHLSFRPNPVGLGQPFLVTM